MKAKVCLGLSVCCLMFAIVGLMMTHLDAQIHKKYPMPDGTKKILWDYDSGWVSINKNQMIILTHNLGGNPEEYFVYYTGKCSPYLINHMSYGTNAGAGAHWYNLDSADIGVYRSTQDGCWEEVRVRILKNQ